RAHVLGDHIEHVGRQPPGDTHLVLFFRRLYRDGHGVGWGVSARGAFVAQRLLWYKARAFQANQRHTRAAHPSAGCLARKGARSLRGRVEVQPETRSFRWPTSRCVECWKRASISDTRPASGTRRWPRTSSANVTKSTSSISRSR